MLTDFTGTDLAYNIVEEVLVGRIDDTAINAHAVAGGRAGSKTPGAVNSMLANNPYATGIKKVGNRPGGPLIMGEYRLVTHESRANWIRLEPNAENSMQGRAGFAIHGRGARGSDGCIVPTDFNQALKLYSLVKARETSGKPAPTLAVVAIGDLDFIERRLRWS